MEKGKKRAFREGGGFLSNLRRERGLEVHRNTKFDTNQTTCLERQVCFCGGGERSQKERATCGADEEKSMSEHVKPGRGKGGSFFWKGRGGGGGGLGKRGGLSKRKKSGGPVLKTGWYPKKVENPNVPKKRVEGGEIPAQERRKKGCTPDELDDKRSN